jgi:hypothetical protein
MRHFTLKNFIIGLVCIFAAIGLFLVLGYFAVKFGITNEKGVIDVQREAFFGADSAQPAAAENRFTGPWQESEEWMVMDAAIRRDQAVIERAARDSDVSSRLIVANLVSEREAYKKWFYPLKILGPQSQFSWGVMGMKEDTAVMVENNLKDPASPYYLGPQYEHLLDFKTADVVAGERFTRMTDQHDHYWSYLYAGLYLKQIETQWERAGFPIDDRPDVLSTLFNIGFKYSVPKANPQVGGAAITLSNGTKSFGGLAQEFYDSDLLIDIFPR